METLVPKRVQEVLTRFFPARHDDYECGYVEELRELNDFGITTDRQLVDLLQKRAAEAMGIDRSPMNDYDIHLYSDDLGKEFVARRLREGFWFSYPALLRIALELEYGDRYVEYANRRDGVGQLDAASAVGQNAQAGNSEIAKTAQ